MPSATGNCCVISKNNINQRRPLFFCVFFLNVETVRGNHMIYLEKIVKHVFSYSKCFPQTLRPPRVSKPTTCDFLSLKSDKVRQKESDVNQPFLEENIPTNNFD